MTNHYETQMPGDYIFRFRRIRLFDGMETIDSQTALDAAHAAERVKRWNGAATKLWHYEIID